MSLKVTVVKKQPEVFTVLAAGSIDSETYKDLEKEVKTVLDSSAKAIVFDMAGVTYISSMGLSVIFKTKAAIEAKGGTLAIINLSPRIKEVFEIVKVIPDYIFTNMEEADEYLDAFLSDMEDKK